MWPFRWLPHIKKICLFRAPQVKNKPRRVGVQNKSIVYGAFGACGLVAFVFILVGGFVALGLYAANIGGGGSNPSLEDEIANTSCGLSIPTLIDGFQILPKPAGEKLGSEQHLIGVEGGMSNHYCGKNSACEGGCPCEINCENFACNPKTKEPGAGAAGTHTADEEHWYFNTQWETFVWHPNGDISINTSKQAQQARKKLWHSRLIITSIETGKSVVVSAEESGPNVYVTRRDGVQYGAPPEVRKYLGISNPYTGNPKDGKGKIKVGLAQDQNIKLGPCN